MMQLITFGSGLTSVRGGQPTWDPDMVIAAVKRELETNREFQALTNLHLRQLSGRILNFDTWELTSPGDSPDLPPQDLKPRL